MFIEHQKFLAMRVVAERRRILARHKVPGSSSKNVTVLKGRRISGVPSGCWLIPGTPPATSWLP